MITIPIVLVPFVAIGDRAKLDTVAGNGYNSHNLDKRLDLSPLTRNAWNEALRASHEFQIQLRQKIGELENQVNSKTENSAPVNEEEEVDEGETD